MSDLYPTTRLPLADGDLLAAVDLGSNSFHMVVARYVLGQLRIVDRLRETVRLAEGLDREGGLDSEVRQRAMDCLSRFGQRVRDIPPQRVRAIATNTVRRLAAPQAFLMPAEDALGHAIEVVAGREEARLIYLGVAHAQPSKPGELRLVIDIGGGSTECIIGTGFEAIERESLQLGCVATTRRFFENGKLSKKKWREALTEVTAEFQQFAGTYRALGWHEALGSSGTNKAIGEICAAMKLTKGAVTAEALPQVRDRLLQADRIEAIDLPGLSPERRPVIAGGVLILEAAFDALGLQAHAGQQGGDARRRALRHARPRWRRRSARCRGGRADAALRHRRWQAARVEGTALQLFDQVAQAWQLDDDDRLMLHARRAPARAGPGHRAQPVPRARRLRGRELRHRRLLAPAAAVPRRAGAHPSPRHSQVGIRCPARSPARHRAPQRGAAAPGGAAAPRARKRRIPQLERFAPTAIS